MTRCSEIIKKLNIREDAQNDFEKKYPNIFKKIPTKIVKEGIKKVGKVKLNNVEIFYIETPKSGIFVTERDGQVGDEDTGFVKKGFEKYNNEIIDILAKIEKVF